jgi:acetolactate synthase-1/2/3 large subunit
MKASDWIVSELVHLGVTHVFTLQGGFSMHLNDSIGHSALTPVYMLHESGAAFAAAGYAQCGKMGVCVITSGLAQTNALSGIASAYSDYLPLMVISGDINYDLIERREMLNLRQGGQQDVPIDKIAQPITRGIGIARNAAHVGMLFPALWNLALAERGPVWLDIPLNVQQEEMSQ